MDDRWPARRAPGPLVLPVPADPTGRHGPTPGAARGPRWRTSSPGRFVPSEVDPTGVEQRIAEKASYLPPGGAVTGWAALRLHGGAFFDGLERDGRAPAPVPLRVPRQHHPRPHDGVTWLRGPVGPVHEIRGVPCAGAVQATLDAARHAADLRECVVVLDMAAAARLTSPGRLADHLAARSWRGTAGIPRVREALRWATEGSASPQETRLRLVWRLDAGLPPVLVNPPVFDLFGTLLGYPDLLDVQAGLAVEYDGDDHRDALRHSRDVDREAWFRDAGLEVTRATGHDVRRPDRLAARLVAARARALRRTGDRGWTLTAPPWFGR